MKKYMQFRTEPRKLPIVLSIEEIAAVLAAPGPVASATPAKPSCPQRPDTPQKRCKRPSILSKS
jgi:hypothetical protein